MAVIIPSYGTGCGHVTRRARSGSYRDHTGGAKENPACVHAGLNDVLGFRSDSARRAGRGLTTRLDVLAELAELLVAALEQVLGLHALQVAERLGEVLLEVVGGGVRVAVGAAERLLHDRVDHAQL